MDQNCPTSTRVADTAALLGRAALRQTLRGTNRTEGLRERKAGHIYALHHVRLNACTSECMQQENWRRPAREQMAARRMDRRVSTAPTGCCVLSLRAALCDFPLLSSVAFRLFRFAWLFIIIYCILSPFYLAYTCVDACTGILFLSPFFHIMRVATEAATCKPKATKSLKTQRWLGA